MSQNDEWNEFQRNLMSCTLNSLNDTKEYEYRKKRQEELDEILTTNLTSIEKDRVDEVLFELAVVAEHEAELLYRQGLKDCVWLLKNLGVLA